jgi:radical SAM protein with 4Fe4S-binding SPASM domain
MALGQANPQAKILWHLDKVLEWKNTGKTFPILFEIDPTNKCNHNCPWCSFASWREENQDMLCLDTMKKLLKEMRDAGTKAINWTGGGEPLMNPNTIEAIKYAKEIGLDQGIFTNGAVMTEEKAKVLASHMTWVRISVDAYDGESYAESHGTSDKSFDKTIKNIEYLCSIKPRCTVGMGFVINEKNYKGIPGISSIAKRIGADYIQFKPEIRRPGTPQVDPNFFKKEVFPLITVAEQYSDETFNVMVTSYRFNDVLSPETNHGRNYGKCYSHHFQGAIAADGKAYICDHHKGEKEYEIGNIKESSLTELWNSERRKKVIEFLDSTDLSQCQICCRNHELNKFLFHVKHVDERMHPNHV